MQLARKRRNKSVFRGGGEGKLRDVSGARGIVKCAGNGGLRRKEKFHQEGGGPKKTQWEGKLINCKGMKAVRGLENLLPPRRVGKTDCGKTMEAGEGTRARKKRLIVMTEKTHPDKGETSKERTGQSGN